MSKPTGDTPTIALTRAMFSYIDAAHKSLVGIRRRSDQIMKLQKVTSPTDPSQRQLGAELRENFDSAVGAVDKISKSLMRPAGTPEPTATTDSIMEELLKGKKI